MFSADARFLCECLLKFSDDAGIDRANRAGKHNFSVRFKILIQFSVTRFL
jgi:hypothetical protein